MDLNLLDLIQEVYVHGSTEDRHLAQTVHINLNNGITPSFGQIQKLQKAVKVFKPCGRLMWTGQCAGWLKRYGKAYSIEVPSDLHCPFAATQSDPAKWLECPGYRERELEGTES